MNPKDLISVLQEAKRYLASNPLGASQREMAQAWIDDIGELYDAADVAYCNAKCRRCGDDAEPDRKDCLACASLETPDEEYTLRKES